MKRHTDALKALVQTVPALASKTFVTLAPTTSVPYVVIHPFDGIDEQTRFTGPRTTFHPRFVIHSVGVDYVQASAIAEAVKSELIVDGFGVVPNVAGENSQKLTYEVPTGIQVDTDVSPPLYYHAAEVGWTSELL